MRILPKRILIPFIFFAISLVLFSLLLSSLHSSIALPSSLSLVSEVSDLKEVNTNLRSCFCVAFRLDDIMDYSVTNPLIAIMKVFDEKKLDFTIGIVGDSFGDDKRLVSYIKDRIYDGSGINTNNLSEIEIANHSWKHENFTNLTIDEMSDSIRKTNEKIKNMFGVTPTVFIAPYDQFTNDIFVALRENNFTYFSASEKNDPPHRIEKFNASIYDLPQTAYTGDCKICGDGVENASWLAIDHETTLNQINRSLNEFGFAVVTLHAWEYTPGHDQWIFNNQIDENQITELRLLLNEIQNKGLKIVPMSKIVENVR